MSKVKELTMCIVDTCESCPWFVYDKFESVYFCDSTGDVISKITDEDTTSVFGTQLDLFSPLSIPDWCPLPDVL